MVERSCSVKLPGFEVTDLRIALYEHKDHLQKLQEELDAEREASATSASEALSMILRLQGEKAVLIMEAKQYKRMVEEKMSHAEILLELLEDLIHQKELEITNLEYQVQAYRFKLQSLGYSSDLAVDDMRLEENRNVVWKTNDLILFGGKGESSERSSDRSQTPSPEPVLDVCVPVEKEVIEQSLESIKYPKSSLSLHGELDSYWAKIEKLDETVKEITEFRDLLRDKYANLKQDSLWRVQDKFEVPEAKKKENGESNVKLKERKLERKSSKQPRNGSIKRSRASASESSSANKAEYQAELQWLKERIERLEGERCSRRHESNASNQEEEMSLLKQIKDQLSSVQSEIKSLRTTQKSSPRNNPALLSVQEAMLYFWI